MKKAVATRLIAILITGAAVAAVMYAFATIGSPSQERARKLDQQRIGDLQQISSAIDQYYNQYGNDSLPKTLDDLAQDRTAYIPTLTDPATHDRYDYRVTSATAYDLCATFETDGSMDATQPPMMRPYPTMPVPAGSKALPNFWSHGVGHTCFNITVQKWPKPL